MTHKEEIVCSFLVTIQPVFEVHDNKGCSQSEVKKYETLYAGLSTKRIVGGVDLSKMSTGTRRKGSLKARESHLEIVDGDVVVGWVSS